MQVSDDRLPVTEQFTLGGADFGRGFTSALISGDAGWGAKVEVAYRPAHLPTPIAGSEAYVFADDGELEINPRGAFTGARIGLASARVGTRVAFGQKTVVEIEAARTIDEPLPGQGARWRLGLGVSTRF